MESRCCGNAGDVKGRDGDIVADSPTSRSLRQLRADGYVAEVVERWNQYSKTRHDLFGIVDVLAMDGELLAVQATTTGNLSSRIKKSLASPNLRAWLEVPGLRFECWGWAKRGERGKRKLWTRRRVELVLVGTEVEVINHDA